VAGNGSPAHPRRPCPSTLPPRDSSLPSKSEVRTVPGRAITELVRGDVFSIGGSSWRRRCSAPSRSRWSTRSSSTTTSRASPPGPA